MGWNKVALIGVGMIPFGELFDQSWETMIEDAYLNCVKSVDKGFDPKDIEAAWIGVARPELHGQGAQGGVSLTGNLGLAGIPCTRVENGCATGSDAFRNARDNPTSAMLSLGLQGPPLTALSETAMTMFAPQATRHMHEFGTTKEDMALVAVKNRKNGVMDPYAQFRSEVTVEQVMKSPVVGWPLNLLDCCPQTDGAACIIICNADIAEKYSNKTIYVAGVGCGTDYYYMAEKTSFTEFSATVRAAKEAYKMAGIGPDDIDVVELHDCFTITELLSYEDLGFCDKGQAKNMIRKGETEKDGRIAVNPSGGLICKGHPIGATGIAQMCEIYWHLREEVGERQVEIKNGYGMQHNVGGRAISNSVVTILTTHK
ncbi:MAG: hypothetical protein JRL30_30150 [Deltaproteobacteria bacterium]|nr:hypothetical protein [Deltaproteobacteria bacterium]